MKKVVLIIFVVTMFSILWTDVPQVKDEAALLGVLYHQAAAEYTAICHQAYNLAADRILEIDRSQLTKPPAIVLDIDETVLSNSRYNARALTGIAEESGGFYGWVDEMAAEQIAGAGKFLNLADSLGFKIFYVTNRNNSKKEETIGNLIKHGFPQADNGHVLCKTNDSSKEPRRRKISEEFDIVLLMGDNLIDFARVFEGKTIESRANAVKEYSQEFGRKFIILPNAMHGRWIKIINDFRYDLPKDELLQKRLKYLKY